MPSAVTVRRIVSCVTAGHLHRRGRFHLRFLFLGAAALEERHAAPTREMYFFIG